MKQLIKNIRDNKTLSPYFIYLLILSTIISHASSAQITCPITDIDAAKGDVVSDYLLNDSPFQVLEMATSYVRNDIITDSDNADLTFTVYLFPSLPSIGILSDFASICRLQVNELKFGDCADDANPITAVVQNTKSLFLSKLVFTVPFSDVASILGLSTDTEEELDSTLTTLTNLVLFNFNTSVTLKIGSDSRVTYNGKTKVNE